MATHGRCRAPFGAESRFTSRYRVVDHFNTLREAADGEAKVIVTSRHQYFATDRDVRTAPGGQAQALPRIGSNISCRPHRPPRPLRRSIKIASGNATTPS